MPPWLLNAELCCHAAAAGNDHLQWLYELMFFARCGNRWLDEHMVKGNEEHKAVARRAWNLYAHWGIRWDLLEPRPGTAIDVVRSFYIRLKNVITAAYS